ncbi:MAG: hypothetical protein Lokiarch_29190 [Candidatus Lokiarchaeum sp. GC14_75]|nr:MAG: hypothetical protein Lokiarch_29190 [Candidatus Lokiarchaeum sp. GC14_75]
MISSVAERINYLLKKADFNTFILNDFSTKPTKFCFDLLARKGNLIIIIKVLQNIDNLNQDIINDIKSLSKILKSMPILIGIRNRYQKLEDHTIYMRESLPFIAIKTLENVLIKEEYPYILSKRGGGVIYIDGNLMKELRESKLISRKEMADKLDVAKRSVCAYENENMRASEKIAKKIKGILESSEIFRRINIFNSFKFDLDSEIIQSTAELPPFESHVQEILKDIGISTYWYKKGPIPFKLSLLSKLPNIQGQNSPYPLFSGVLEDQKNMNEFAFLSLEMFKELFNQNALFIVSNNVKISETSKASNIPIVSIKKLDKVDDEEEFIELIQRS